MLKYESSSESSGGPPEGELCMYISGADVNTSLATTLKRLFKFWLIKLPLKSHKAPNKNCVMFNLLLYIHRKQLRSCQDGQLF